MKIKYLVYVTFFMLSSTLSFAQEPLLGEIRIFAGNFAPRGWAFCDGQLLSISNNSALFSLLGTTYGGDGRTTFALPDLRSRVPVHAGAGTGLVKITLGGKGGTEATELRKISRPEKISGKSYETYAVQNSYPKAYKRDPYLGVHYIIALQGLYPSRN